MAQGVIQYYKEEHKHFKKVKRDLTLQKKMTKHYARKNMLACAKLKEALMELENLKREKFHDILRFLVEASQQVSKTSLGTSPQILRQFEQFFFFKF